MKKVVSLLLAAVLLGSAAGCQNEPADPSQVSSQQPVSSAAPAPVNVSDLVVSVGAEPSTLDPAGYQTTDDATILSHLFEGLVTIHADGTPIPGQAESFSFNDDKTVCTFTLRENLTWSDGKPLTASDFVYAWRRAIYSKEGQTENSYMFSIIKGYREALGLDAGSEETRVVDTRKLGVSAPDDRTLVVELTGSYDNFLLMCSTPAFFPVRQDVVEETPDWSSQPKAYVCNGPYVMTAWKHNSYVRLSKNPRYYNASAIGPDAIEFVLGGNSLSMLSAFQKGELVFADTVPYTELSQFEDSDEFFSSGELGTFFLGFNTSKSPLDDPRVRRALSLAINRDYLCKWVSMGGESVANALVCDGVADADPDVEFRAAGNEYFGGSSYRKQLELAQNLLEEAGYPKGKGMPELTYLVVENTREIAVANAVAAMWKDNLGVQCHVEVHTDVDYNDKKNQLAYDVIGDQYTDYFNDPSVILGRFQSEHSQNISVYQNPEYDQILEAAANSTEKKERYRQYHNAEDLLMAEAVVCPVYFLHYENYIKRRGIEGFYITPTGYKFFMYVHSGCADAPGQSDDSSGETAGSLASAGE